LGQDILDLSWKTLDLVITANSLPNKQKPPVIKKASVCFDKLKARIKMAHELKLINNKRYAYLIEKNGEIGKMLSGWLGWAEKR